MANPFKPSISPEASSMAKAMITMLDGPQEESGEPTYQREIIDVQLTPEGLFVTPKKLNMQIERAMCIRKTHASFQENYADKARGLQDSIDYAGGYCCAGNFAGTSAPCGRFVIETGECLIRTAHPDNPKFQSCKWWHRPIAGDPQPRLSDADKALNTDEVIAFGETTNEYGFGCVGLENLDRPRCEYAEHMPVETTDEQEYMCTIKGYAVDVIACCGKNPGQS